MRTVAIVLLLAIVPGCSQPAKPEAPAAKPEPPAKLSGPAVKEGELVTVTLTPEAEQRLGIRTEKARSGGRSQVRQFTGEVTAPQGTSIVVSSSVAGTLRAAPGGIPAIGTAVRKDQPLFTLTPFLPLSRELSVSAEAEAMQARARVDAARQKKARADRMLADQVGTVRAQEEAQQEVTVAQSVLEAAEYRLRQLQGATPDGDFEIPVRTPRDGMLRQVLVASGQTVSAGTPLFEVADLGEVWVRVPVYVGEAPALAANSSVTVQALNGTGQPLAVEPVAAPPSADAASSTIHLYYKLANENLRFRPGEKLLATFATSQGSGPGNRVDVPWSSIVFDTHGGSWLYESLGDRRYSRRRVDLDHSASGRAYLNAGIRPGVAVVAEGAAELWGFEFGTGK